MAMIGSRTHVLNRRSSYIEDLNVYDTGTGSQTIADAIRSGILRFNSTHQMGIATQSEAGLDEARFPVRVTMHPKFRKAPKTVACLKWWSVTDVGGRAYAFQRRVLPEDSIVKLYYTIYPDLDDDIWDVYDEARGSENANDLTDEMMTLVDLIYEKATIPNPVQPILASLHTDMESLKDLCKLNQKFYRLKLAEGMYLVGDPVGKKIKSRAGVDGELLTATEYAACVELNYNRLKTRYPSLSTGAILLASYSVATIFRHGLFEHYECEEYHTVRVEGQNNDIEKLKVVEVLPARRRGPPDQLDTHTVIDISSFRVVTKLVELSLGLVCMAGLNHYLFNHTTGGSRCTGPLLSILAMYNIFSKNQDDNTASALTDLFYEVLHPVNKRAIANLFFKTSGVFFHGKSPDAYKYEQINADSFIQLRLSPQPAGSHKAFLCLTVLSRVISSHYYVFLPWASEIDSCIQSCEEIVKAGAKGHIGAYYYTGSRALVQPSALDNYMPELAAFVQTLCRLDTIALSPHLGPDIAARASVNWVNLLRDLKAKDVSGTDTEVARAYIKAAGSSMMAFDPEEPTTWHEAISNGTNQAKRIKLVLDAV